MFCVVGDAWTGMSPVLPRVLSNYGGSKVFGVFYGVVDSLLGMIERSIYGIAYDGVTYICGVTHVLLISWVCGGY